MPSSLNHKLHSELLSEIFHLCVLDAKTKTLGMGSEAPLVLCWICKPWRSVALSTPRLWTRLDFNPRIWNKKGVMQLTERWLMRSGTLPIQFSFCWANKSVEHIASIAIVNRLVQDIWRWQSISFWQECKLEEQIIWALPAIPLGTKPLALTSASLRLSRGTLAWTASHYYWFHSIVVDTRNLQSFSLDCNIPASRLTSTTNTRHLAQLTHLILGYTWASKVIQIIGLLPHLEHLKAKIWKGEVLSQISTIMHHKIQILHLYDAPAEFLDLLILPSLRDFSLIMTGEGQWPRSSLESLIQRSSSKVTRLGIQSKDMTATEMIQCFQFPGLEHFRIYDGPYIDRPLFRNEERIVAFIFIFPFFVSFALVAWDMFFNNRPSKSMARECEQFCKNALVPS
ncbi:hypothetical protein C8J56DRAFT_898743 [Mycena floridula]|nr:hypothetical protein C8J56DRAFT_898743 [Mycena floridula]